MNKKWFRALVPGGHVGAGRVEERVIYLYAEDICHAEMILHTRTGGWKKHRGPIELRALSGAEVSAIERVVKIRGNISIAAAMRDGFLYADSR